MSDRVLVRLNTVVPLTAEHVNDALAVGHSPKLRYRSPGAGVVLEALKDLERLGLARRQDAGWVLTDAGNAQYNRLDDAFENSGRWGDYGF